MGGDDNKFMALVEFVCLLNPLQSAAQSPETLQAITKKYRHAFINALLSCISKIR